MRHTNRDQAQLVYSRSRKDGKSKAQSFVEAASIVEYIVQVGRLSAWCIDAEKMHAFDIHPEKVAEYEARHGKERS